jgi:cytochrome c oxidase cbb3-type subunit 4
VTYENVRDFAAGFGFLFMAATYLVAIAWPFRRQSRTAHEHAANMIFDEEDQLPPKENGCGR